MGKIYGVHDSYCALVSPSKLAPGEAKSCTCESGKKVHVEVREKVEREQLSEEHAERVLIGARIQSPGFNPSPEELSQLKKIIMEAWLRVNPEVTLVEAGGAAPPVAVPATAEDIEFVRSAGGSGDGLGEKDGPWARDWKSRRGVPRFEPSEAFKEAIQPQVEQMAKAFIPPKSDQGKPKPFSFFIQQFPLGMNEVARHMEKGCSDPGHVFLGWQEVGNGYTRYSDAMLRHTLEEVVRTVTDIDREDGVDKGWVEEKQAIAVAANALIRLELLLRKRRNLNLDARPEA